MPNNNETKSIYGIHYYDSILVLEKREITKPWDSITGSIVTIQR
jgi:hypothetical protein